VAHGRRGASIAVRDAQAIRTDIRADRITHHTSGMAPGFARGTLVILPKFWAADRQAEGRRLHEKAHLHKVRVFANSSLASIIRMTHDGIGFAAISSEVVAEYLSGQLRLSTPGTKCLCCLSQRASSTAPTCP
jgi:DNA-binding transcriptional LysR family regulator